MIPDNTAMAIHCLRSGNKIQKWITAAPDLTRTATPHFILLFHTNLNSVRISAEYLHSVTGKCLERQRHLDYNTYTDTPE